MFIYYKRYAIRISINFLVFDGNALAVIYLSGISMPNIRAQRRTLRIELGAIKIRVGCKENNDGVDSQDV